MTASTLAAPLGVTAWDRDVVAAFDRGGEDILIVERPAVPGVAGASLARVHDFRSVVTLQDAGDRAVAALAALNLDAPALAADVAALARSFLIQFEVEEVSLRVELSDRTSCPKFHCDNVRVRLVTTYHGPTTEYVRADAPQEIRSAPGFALVLLKGHQHPTHADAVHHRSPALPDGWRRLCVVLDT